MTNTLRIVPPEPIERVRDFVEPIPPFRPSIESLQAFYEHEERSRCRKPSQKQFTSEQVTEINGLRRAGWTRKQVAKHFKCDDRRIAAVEESGLDLRRLA